MVKKNCLYNKNKLPGRRTLCKSLVLVPKTHFFDSNIKIDLP